MSAKRGRGERERVSHRGRKKKRGRARGWGLLSPFLFFCMAPAWGSADTRAAPLSRTHTHTHTHSPSLAHQPPPRTEMSDAYKAKLRKEYLSLGGSPNTAMGGNYFLYIIILVAVLAVITKLSGAI